MRPLLLFLIMLSLNITVEAKDVKYISLAPSLTEMVYSINAQDNLIAGVAWNRKLMKNKPVIGDAFFVNNEALVKYHPDIIFALEYQKTVIDGLKSTGIKIHYFSFKSINDIFNSIKTISNLTNHSKNGDLLILTLKRDINKYKAKSPKRILFVVQAEPLISAGKNSFINDIIKQSGHINILDNMNNDYPRINLEYVIKQNPDLIVVWDKQTKDYLKKFLRSKFVILEPADSDCINRPGPGVVNAVKFFANL
ncbi:MAG: helical backbone metal receptor [Candidatus Gastranaerophilales bacterium]|nr:helical backbone metal receptor [Candidatus Gastranaerophilales bacterium]